MNTHEEEENQINNPNTALIQTFIEITSASNIEAQFYLESHGYDLDAAVSTFLDSSATAAPIADGPVPNSHLSPSQSPPRSASPSTSQSPSRSRSASPPPPTRASQYSLRSKSDKKASGSRAGRIRTFSDLNQTAGDGSGSDSDGPQEYYTGGEKSGMLVQDPSRKNDPDAIFNQARQSSVPPPADQLPPSSSSKSFTGTARLLSGETVSTAAAAAQQPEAVTHSIVFWTNGFTIDDGPLRRFDDPANASFLESIKKSECPKELEPADRRAPVHVSLSRREEKGPEPEIRRVPFQGVGRTLGNTASPSAVEPPTATTPLVTAPPPSLGLIVDQSLPSTSIQLRLADGTRMVSRFNYNHTINDIRSFIDASRPGGSATYQLQTVGFPPKQLTDLNQTIEQAGLASSVIIQKF